MLHLSLTCFGPFAIAIDGQPVATLRNAKAQAMLAYLAMTQTARREALMALLWPDVLAQSAQGSLRQTLFKLRQAVPAGLIVSDRQTIGIGADCTFDVAQFEQLVDGNPTLAQLETAVSLYTDDFLQGFYLADSNPFEQWVLQQRERLHQKLLSALHQLAIMQQQAEDYDAAEATIRQALARDPLSEVAHQQLLKLLTAVNRRSEALSHYQTFGKQLQAELGLAPSAETAAIVEAIRAGKQAAPASPQPAISIGVETAVPAIPNNLPTLATPFIGRASELAALDALLRDPDVSLITITGPGGMGKTRLALAVAETAVSANQQTTASFADGVFFVPLAGLRQPDQILSALLETINMPPDLHREALIYTTHGQQHSQLRRFWQQKRLLIILDNFEHILEGGTAVITSLLKMAPHVTVLATSRERLRLQGEQVFPIEGLLVPDLLAAEEPTAYASVRLFLQSARRVLPDFGLGDEDLPDLADICRYVEGMPLGLELAASWVDMLPLATIAEEIRQGVDFLEAETRDVAARHRSIRAVFDYSWQHLTLEQQKIFGQLSTFRGGFTRQAAQAVTGASLRTLSTLVGKSLLQYRRTTDRYGIHMLLRQYGREKLVAAGSKAETVVLQQHSRHFCHWLKANEEHLKGAQDLVTIAQIEADIENIRLAWQTAVFEKNSLSLHEASDGLFIYFVTHGRFLECISLFGRGVDALRQPVDQAAEEAQRIHIRLKLYLAHLHLSIEQVPEAEALLQTVATEMEQLADQNIVLNFAPAMYQMGLAKLHANQYRTGEAQKLMLACLAQFEMLGDQFWIDHILLWLGRIAQDLGTYEEARHWYGKSLALARARGNQRQMATALTSLGWIARVMGAYDEARERFDEGYSLAQANKDDWAIIRALENQAYLSLFLGEFPQAINLLQQAIGQSRQVGNQLGLIYGLVNLGVVKWLEGEGETAVSHMEQGHQAAQEMGVSGDIGYTLASLAEVNAALGHTAIAQQQVEAARGMLYPSDQYSIGRVNRTLGWLALGRGDYEQAYENFYGSVINYEAIDDQEYKSLGLALLSAAAIGSGRLEEGYGYLYEGVTMAVRIRAVIPLYTILPLLALALAEAGATARANEVAAAVCAHPFVQSSPILREILGELALKGDANVMSHEGWFGLAETAVSWLTELGWQDKILL
ncbi:MAG: BTAD domain-containing putative transcriptional regulator [Chloroflexota bacterium]